MPRDAGEDEAFQERRPRRRGRPPEEDESFDEEEDFDPDEGSPPVGKKKLSWLDRQFLNTWIVLLVLFPLCFGLLAFIFGMIGLVACRDAQARQRATMVLVMSAVWIGTVLGLFLSAVLPPPPVRY